MKSTSQLVSFIAIAMLSVVDVASAKGKPSDSNEKSVDAKCYVELVGGSETISLWRVKSSLLNKLPHTIVGQKILVRAIYEQTPSKEKLTIYKVKECVLEGDEFSSPRARAIDKELPR